MLQRYCAEIQRQRPSDPARCSVHETHAAAHATLGVKRNRGKVLRNVPDGCPQRLFCKTSRAAFAGVACMQCIRVVHRSAPAHSSVPLVPQPVPSVRVLCAVSDLLPPEHVAAADACACMGCWSTHGRVRRREGTQAGDGQAGLNYEHVVAAARIVKAFLDDCVHVPTEL